MRMTGKKLMVIGTTLLVIGLAWEDLAEACAHYVEEHLLDSEEQQLDSEPPGLVEVLSAEITGRGQGVRVYGNSIGATSTDGIGVFELRIVPPVDNRTVPEMMGYRIELVDGKMPENLLPDYDFRARDGVVYLSWADGDTDYQEEINFSFSIRAIDLAGNLGALSQPMEVYHPGSAGCSTGGGGPPTLFTWLFVLLLLWRIRFR